MLGETIWFENERVRVWDLSGEVAARESPCIVVTTHGDGRGRVERLSGGGTTRVDGAVGVELLDGAQPSLGGPGEPTAAPAVRSETYDPSDYADELAGLERQERIGDEVWYQDDDVRVWSISLDPAARVPFHCHRRTYFWVCTDEGSGRQRFLDGTLSYFDFRRGDVDFLDISPQDPLMHDLENVGESRLRFLAVELLARPADSD